MKPPHLTIEALEITAATLQVLRDLGDDPVRHQQYTTIMTEVNSVIRNSKDISIGQ